MPIDTNIYALQRPVGINTPFENLSQVLQLKNQQENLQSQAVLRQAEAQRQAGEAQKLQQQQSDQAAVDQAMAGSGGDFDKAISALQQRGAGHLVPVLQKIQEQAQTAQKLHEGVLDAQNQYAAHLASSVLSWKDDKAPDGGQGAMMNALQGAKVIAQQHGYDVSPILQAVQQDPSSLEKRMNAVIALAQGPQKPEKVGAGEQLVTPGAGTAAPTVNYTAPAKPEPVTEATLDAAYQGVLKKIQLGQPLTADDAATKKSYEMRKLLGPEAAAANAANQQARAQAQQNTLEQNRQDFAMQQAGRKELQDKIEAPWLTAKASAQTLRDTVSSAQAGNKIGASLQALETTMSAVRAQGLNRVNMAEIGLPANAGSAWDRIQGWFGKATQGQPVPADIQKDMLQFADILDKGADLKYKQGWQATTKRYRLNDEQPLVPLTNAPSGGGASAPAASKESPEHRVWRLTGQQGPEPK